MDVFLAKLSAVRSNPSLLTPRQLILMRRLLDEAVPSSDVIAQLINAMDPKFTSVHPGITDEHFPCVPPSIEGAVLEMCYQGTFTERTRRDLASRGRRGMTPAEVLLYWKEHPECHQCCLIALGHEWDGQVVVLVGCGSNRSASLYPVGTPWNIGSYIPSLPL